ISSAAARKRRMAASPGLSLPRSCARAEVPFANKPAPTVAAPPARRPLFIKERRSTGRIVLLTGFFIVAPLVPICVTKGPFGGDDPRVTIDVGDDVTCRGIVKLMSFYFPRN